MIKIYTDGSCSANGKGVNTGGYGVIIIDPIDKKINAFNGHGKNTTSNRMEITAAIEGLKICESYGYPIELYSDSQYLVYTITKNWKKNKNLDLWNELNDALKKHSSVTFIWIKGHHTTRENNLCDKLASKGSKEAYISLDNDLAEGLSKIEKLLA